MRKLFLAGTVALIAAGALLVAKPAHANAANDFCMMTAKLTYNVIEAKAKLTKMPDLSQIEAELNELFTALDAAGEGFTAQQKAATIRAVRFGYGAPKGADPETYAKYQYIGCLATEI